MGIPFHLSTRYSTFNAKSKSHFYETFVLSTMIFLVSKNNTHIQTYNSTSFVGYTGIMQKLHVSELNEFIEDQFHECNEVISNSFIACETKIMGP